MTRNDLVLAAAVVAALITAWRFRSLGGVRVLVPLDPARPTAHFLGDRLLFRFANLGALGAWAESRPRLLLAAFQLPLWGLLLNLMLPGRGDFAEFVARAAIWTVVALLIAGGGAAGLTGVLVVVWQAISAGFDYDPTVSGYIAGAFIGLPAGGAASIGLLGSIHESRLALRSRRTRDGTPIPPGRLMMRRFQLILQFALPVMAVHTALRYFVPELDLRQAARMLAQADPGGTGTTGAAAAVPAAAAVAFHFGKFTLAAAAAAIACNVLWQAGPMYARLVENSAVSGAAAFNMCWTDREEKRRTADPKNEEDQKELKDLDEWVKGGLDAEGRWNPFGTPQTLALFLVTLYLTLKGFHEAVESFAHAGMTVDHADWISAKMLIGGIVRVADVWLAVVLLVSGFTRLFGKGRNVENNLDLLHRSFHDPNLTLICRKDGWLEAVAPPAGAAPPRPASVPPRPGLKRP